MSKDSLELTDIVKQLSLSKNFKPLLHLGWREKPQDRNIAIANHIFAGDNLTTHYQKSLQTYQKAMNEGLVNTTMTMNDASNENTIDGSLVNNLSSNQLLPSDLSPDNLSTNEEQLNKTKLLQDSIDNILAHISQVSANDEQEIINDLAINKVNTNDNTSVLKVPELPLQPWFLDGFFKVHLNHYLYITADFNIMNMSLDEQSNLTSSINTEVPELKTIRFEQNRRVISKEIHYFDHPYMGMIVQIRPFNVPEPEVEVAAEIDDISSAN